MQEFSIRLMNDPPYLPIRHRDRSLWRAMRLELHNERFMRGTLWFPRLYRNRLLILFTLFSVIQTLTATSSHAKAVRTQYAEAELITEMNVAAPGSSFRAALRLKPAKDWHVYWINPGDAGLAPTLEWQLPDGFTVGDMEWPYPHAIPTPPLMTFGYSEEVVYPLRVEVPADARPGASFTLRAEADWLICKEECLPEQATLELRVQVGRPQPHAKWNSIIGRAVERLPLDMPEWRIQAEFGENTVVLRGSNLQGDAPALGRMTFFPIQPGVMDNAAPQEMRAGDGEFVLRFKRDGSLSLKPDTVFGVLVAEGGWLEGAGDSPRRALNVAAPITASNKGDPDQEPGLTMIAGSGAAISGVSSLHAGGASETVAGSGTPLGLPMALLFAFLGGLILNLMPCVLPVVSLKVLDFVKKAGESRRRIFLHGLVFTAGVLVSFWVLALALITLKSSGAQLGWGFQLQSPVFVFLLCAFIFLFALNLLGVFEMGLFFTRLQTSQGNGSAFSGSFLNGVTATLVATPCTAPFMGSALGFGLTLPALPNLLLFSSLGLGMALPYLLLGAFPGFLRYLPKPGRWMESLKQFMGFLLLGTMVWLAWVLGHLAGSDAVAALLATCVGLGLGAWVLSRWADWSCKPRTRYIALSLTALLWAAAVYGGIRISADSAPPGITATAAMGSAITTPSASGEIPWEPFSRARLDALRKQGSPVFVNFTAAWCLSCKVNERVALRSAEVVNRFQALGITALKADWTQRDAEIASVLAAFGRSGIPLYVLYDGVSDTPKLLPEVLTPGIVLGALESMRPKPVGLNNPNPKEES